MAELRGDRQQSRHGGRGHRQPCVWKSARGVLLPGTQRLLPGVVGSTCVSQQSRGR